MQISKEKLQKALEIVKPGLANKDIIEQATSFAFMDGKVFTYNDEISISHPIDAIDITGAIDAQNLYQLLGKLKKEEIDIEITDSEIILKSGRATAGLVFQSEIKLPLEEVSTISKWKKLPELFIKACEFVVGSAGHDMSRANLTCVHVNNGGFIEASDGLRITKFMVEGIPIKTFLIPATSCLQVIKLKPISIAEGKGWVHFKTEEGTIISCRIFEDDIFPDTKPHFKVEGTEITFPKTSAEVLDRASVFAKREHLFDESIEITLENKRFRIKSESETGWFEEELNGKYEGDSLTFQISPYLLRGIFAETLTCTLSKDRLQFEGENWKSITALKNIGK